MPKGPKIFASKKASNDNPDTVEITTPARS